MYASAEIIRLCNTHHVPCNTHPVASMLFEAPPLSSFLNLLTSPKWSSTSAPSALAGKKPRKFGGGMPAPSIRFDIDATGKRVYAHFPRSHILSSPGPTPEGPFGLRWPKFILSNCAGPSAGPLSAQPPNSKLMLLWESGHRVAARVAKVSGAETSSYGIWVWCLMHRSIGLRCYLIRLLIA